MKNEGLNLLEFAPAYVTRLPTARSTPLENKTKHWHLAFRICRTVHAEYNVHTSCGPCGLRVLYKDQIIC